MQTNIDKIKTDFVGHLWEKSWTYIKTVVDVVHEPILILDQNLRVMVANERFYRTFQVEQQDTENKVVYELGNGQWNIVALRKLLEDILPKNTFFRGFEVAHNFPVIGPKVMILNAREIHFKDDQAFGQFPPIILLAMEDVTEMMMIAETISTHSKKTEARLTEKTHVLELKIKKLENEIRELKR